MTWKNIPNDISKYAGFVYIIKHNDTKAYYIGKKIFWQKVKKRITRKPTKIELTRLETYKLKDGKKFKLYKKKLTQKYKGKKKIKRSIKESDWKDYWGSSKKFIEYIKEYGKENFTREIIYPCETRSEMSYKELIEQINNDVLNDNNSFNGIIHIRLNRTK